MILAFCAVALFSSPRADAASELLPATLAGLERGELRTLTPSEYVQSQRRDPYHARVYVACGLKSVLEAEYHDGKKSQERLTLFEMESPLGALCAFGNDKTLDGNPLQAYEGPQAEAYRVPGALFLRQGRYYARIKGSHQNYSGGKKAHALLQALSSSLPSPQSRDSQIEALRQLPAAGRIPGSERYLPNGVFGFAELGRGYSADYACGEIGASIANVSLPSGVDAEAVLKRTIAEAKARDYLISPWAFGDEGYVARQKSGQNAVYFLRVGRVLAALDADQALGPECHFMGEELAAKLRERQRTSSAK